MYPSFELSRIVSLYQLNLISLHQLMAGTVLIWLSLIAKSSVNKVKPIELCCFFTSVKPNTLNLLSSTLQF